MQCLQHRFVGCEALLAQHNISNSRAIGARHSVNSHASCSGSHSAADALAASAVSRLSLVLPAAVRDVSQRALGSSDSSSGNLVADEWGELTASTSGRRNSSSSKNHRPPAKSRGSSSSSSSRYEPEPRAQPPMLAPHGGARQRHQDYDSLSRSAAASRDRSSSGNRRTPGTRSSPQHTSGGRTGDTSSSCQDLAGRRFNPAQGSSGGSGGGSSTSSTSVCTKKQRKQDKKAAAITPSSQPCCYGCGAVLQTQVAAAAGYVPPDKYSVKRKHKQLNKVLCARCSDLCNGAMIPAVQDFTQKTWLQEQQQLLQQHPRQSHQQQKDGQLQQQLQQQEQPSAVQPTTAATSQPSGDVSSPGPGQLELLGKLLVTPEQLREKLTSVRGVKALVVLLVDLLDASGTLMSKVRDMVGNNPIVLIGTKMDLLPAGCNPKQVATWLAEAAGRKRLQVASAHLVSSHTGEGIAAVTAKVCRERKGRDVFVVGAANVGKSAFVRAMLNEMSSFTGGNFDAAALATSRFLPVESAMPGTTLGLIPLQAFETGGTLYDTPGVHLHHRIPHMLTPTELKLLHPRKQLTAYSPAAPLEIYREQQEYEQLDRPAGSAAGAGLLPYGSNRPSKPKQVSATYIWSGLVRVDIVSGPPSSCIVFYGPPTLRVYGLPLLEDGQEFHISVADDDHSSADEQPQPTSDQRAAAGSKTSRTSSSSSRVLLCKDSVKARGGLVPHTLVVKSPIPTSNCLADVAVSGLPGWIGVFAPFSKQDVVLRIWVPRGVEVFLRPPLPCPTPPKPQGADDAAGPEDLEVDEVLSQAELNQDWDTHRDFLGLGPMSKQDEEVVKMLLFGNGSAGLTGIVDIKDEGEQWLEDDKAEQLGEAEDQQQVLRAEQLVHRVATSSARRSSGSGSSRRQR